MRIRKRLQLYFGLCKYYGQRKEDKIVAKFFGDFKGTLLSIGENDGLIYSNVLYFIKRGWAADLVEPAPKAFRRLYRRHCFNSRVCCHEIAIGSKSGKAIFWESDSVVNLGDTDLISSINPRVVDHWPNTAFRQGQVDVLTFFDFLMYRAKWFRYDLISIDAELSDMEILPQIDFAKLGCRCIVLEHAGNPDPIVTLVSRQGFRLLATTEENLIFVRYINY